MRIDLAGAGPGSLLLMTGQVQKALQDADLIITSEHLANCLQGAGGLDGRILRETVSGRILGILEEESFRHAVCLFSGDSSFYSGAAPLLELLEASALVRERKACVSLLPGISSLSCACARLGISLQDVSVFSAHGRFCDPVRCVMNGKKSFFLTGGTKGPAALCGELTLAGLGSLEVTVLEMLSEDRERIRTMTAREAAEQSYLPLSVMVAERAPVSEHLRRRVPGIADEAFVRGRVPMTKRLIRVSALSLLNPSEDDLCWDLGAGTGSVSIELCAHCRSVISVERDPEAVRLMEENRKRFGAWNMRIRQGEVPRILEELPLPDRIFIGGGGRQIRAVLDSVSARLTCGAGTDPGCGRMPVITATAVTLETLQAMQGSLEEHGYETRVMQVAVTQAVKRGSSHMLSAMNPVFLIAGVPSEDQNVDPKGRP